MACLLILLCCYNNPLFALGVYFPGVVLSTVMAALQSAFLSALFLFWLCFLDVLRISSDGSAAVSSAAVNEDLCYARTSPVLCVVRLSGSEVARLAVLCA